MQINELLKYTLDSGASDLHLSVGSIPSIRLNGEINNLKLPVMDAATMEGISKDILDKHELDHPEWFRLSGRLRNDYIEYYHGEQ